MSPRMLSIQKKCDAALRQWREQFSCNDSACISSGRMWKRVSNQFRRLRLHGAQFCFPGCFERKLMQRFTRFLSVAPVNTRWAHRIPLGLMLLSRGDIDDAQLREALAAQRAGGEGRIGDWMQRLGFIGEQQVTAALGGQWACPVLPRVPDVCDDSRLPAALLRRFHMAPVSYVAATRTMHVAFSEGIDYSVLLAIEQALQCRTEPCVAGRSALGLLWARMEEAPRRSDQVFTNVRTPDEMTRITANYAAMLKAQDVRLTRCAEFIWARVEAGEASANLLFPAAE
jgi:hypothetical protein